MTSSQKMQNFLILCVVVLLVNSWNQSKQLHQQMLFCQLILNPHNADSQPSALGIDLTTTTRMQTTTTPLTTKSSDEQEEKFTTATTVTRNSIEKEEKEESLPIISAKKKTKIPVPVRDEKEKINLKNQQQQQQTLQKQQKQQKRPTNNNTPNPETKQQAVTAIQTNHNKVENNVPTKVEPNKKQDKTTDNAPQRNKSKGNDAIQPSVMQQSQGKPLPDKSETLSTIEKPKNQNNIKEASPKKVSDARKPIPATQMTSSKAPTRSFADILDIKMKQCTNNMTQPIRFISIHGERHHGTNFARTLINKNKKRSVRCVRDPIHGWKHGLLDPELVQLREDQLLLIITRDAFSWLPKMYKEMYCFRQTEADLKVTFSTFLRKPYLCYPHKKNNETETAPNIVQIRTRKYKNWLDRNNPKYFAFDAKPPFCTRLHLRYESITHDGQEATIGKMLQSYGIRKEGEFQQIVKRTGPLGPNGVVYSAETIKREAQEVLERYTLQDLQFVLDNLNLELERTLFNYTYDYVVEHMEERALRMRNNVTVPK